MHRRPRRWSSTSGLHAPILITRGWRDTGILSARATTGTLVTGPRRHTPARTGRRPAITSIVTTGSTGGAAGIAIAIGMRTAMTIGITATVGVTATATITNLQVA